MTTLVAEPPSGWWSRPLLRWSIAILGAVLAGLLVFQALNIPVFSLIGLPHEVCYVQDTKLVWLHVTSDLLIGVSYVSISATLAYLVYRASRDIPFHWVFLAFGLFIVSCGITHFMEVWVIWQPVYWLSGYAKVITAAASVATAIALFPLVPKIFQLIAGARQSEQHRAEIERLNEDLERFNYSVAHDLRAPLRSITGFSAIMREDFGERIPPEAMAYVDRMQRSAERMDALVTGLLRYATVGRQPIAVRPVDLGEVVRSATALLEQEIAARSAEIRVDELTTVLGDETLLLVVAQNLISNAVKFVAPGVRPVVAITTRFDGPSVILSVRDNGIGFPPAGRDRVFGMFERFHPEHPGTGIGLALVHRAVQRLHGRIEMQPLPHGGTEFLVWLPGAA